MKTNHSSFFLARFIRLNVSAKKPYVSGQQGVVLVFSLITLLLLTLLGVNMIQQNRLEFMMAGNAQMQTQAFASAEGLLKVAEDYINAWHGRYSQECREPITDGIQVTYQCYNGLTDNYDILQVLDLVPNQRIPDKLYHCPTPTSGVPDEFNSLQATDEDPNTPQWEITNSLGLDSDEIGAATGTNVSITSIACLRRTTNDEVICKNEAQNGFLENDFACNSISINCASAVYNIKVVSMPPGSFAARSVESKYAVRCDDNNVVTP